MCYSKGPAITANRYELSFLVVLKLQNRKFFTFLKNDFKFRDDWPNRSLTSASLKSVIFPAASFAMIFQSFSVIQERERVAFKLG